MDKSSQESHSTSFRDSTHLIPDRVMDKKRPRPYDPLIMNVFLCVFTAGVMMALGIALEVALNISYKNNGFKVPRQNAVTFVSQQFLLSFVPTLFVIPVAFLWREIDWMVRWYQPYVVLSRGRAMAEESLLLDYIALGTFFTLFRALKYKHRIVFWSSLTAAATYIFQPLAGSIFQIRQLPETTNSTVTSRRLIGLVPDVNQLNDFVAAAGYAEAAVEQNLPDPPFVRQGWATAEFDFPTISGVNGSMSVRTTGVQTSVDCKNPAKSQLALSDNTNFIISATSVEGCSTEISFDPRTSSQQYGVAPVQCNGAQTNITFQPVMFWFFHRRTDDNTPEAKSVFCAASIKTFNVNAFANINNASLADVQMIDDYTTSNNVTGAPLNGQAFNAVLFAFTSPDDSQNNATNADSFQRARAQTVRSGVSGAIFRLASQQDSGLQGTFDLPNGFLDLTSRVYRQHLSITAKSVYFVKSSSQLDSLLTQYLPRLWIDPLPGHALAIMLFLIGFLGVFIHILGRRARRNLVLCAPPGSIAAVMALTSRSGFGELLLPYDDEKVLEQKLSGMRYRLDSRTGAIVADETSFVPSGNDTGRDEAMMSLLGKHHEPQRDGHERDRSSATSLHDNSSQFALQAAAGYPPWVTKETP